MTLLSLRLGRRVPCHDVAIDLGTGYTRVFAPGRGVVAEGPSVVRIPVQRMLPFQQSEADAGVRPVSGGVVNDVAGAARLVAPVLRRASGAFVRPSVLACAPTDASDGEIDRLREALRRAGAARVTVAPEPLAAAVGAGLDVSSEYSQALVDIGEGVTDVAVIREGRIEASHAVRIGCSELRAAVAARLRARYGVSPRGEVVEDLIHRADRARACAPGLRLEVVEGVGGGRRVLRVEATDVLEAMAPILDRIAGAVRATWVALPAEASCEVIESGLWLTGGGAHLGTLVERVERTTSIATRVPDDPLHAVIRGAGRMASSPQSN